MHANLLGRAQPVIPPNLYSMLMNIIAWGPQVIQLINCLSDHEILILIVIKSIKYKYLFS